MGDRCFASFLGITGLSRRGVDVLFRMHQRRRFDFRPSHRGCIDDYVVVWSQSTRPEWIDEANSEDLSDPPEPRESRVGVVQAAFRVNQLVLVTTIFGSAD